ncbi:tetratricopeptide repeat protein [Paenibacillus sp. UNC451MF]|uniref:tetratricopeptide repeat protein n=1 Tax=Paenibacillus sp. UNC451MF TaxID=1449063 RepID=UPI00048ADE80|nr:tetratricopeptide repeat protein [Paenibacillus sp. UNC451MF]
MTQNKLALILLPILLIVAAWFIYPSIIKPAKTAVANGQEYIDAMTLIQQGKLDAARKKLEAGLAKEPGEGKYDFAMGNIERLQSNQDNALAYYLKAVQKSPHLKEAYNNITGIYMLQQKYDDALTAINNGLGQDPKYKELLFKKGQLLYLKGDNAQAIEVLQPLINDAEYVEAYRFIALAYVKQNNRQQAAQALKTYLQKTPQESKGREELENLLADLEK